MPHECFADEIAIDFPSVGPAVERMRDRFLGEPEDRGDGRLVQAEVSVSRFEAAQGLVVPVDVPVNVTCRHCGGRGETWTEPCVECAGTGHSLFHHAVRVNVPPGVADGARFRFRVQAPDFRPVRVEVRVVIRPAAI